VIRRSAVIATEVVAGLLAAAALLAGLAFWRLTTGPVDLDFLTPQIEAALSDPDKGFEVRIGRTELTWGGENRTVDLHTRQVHVFGNDGAILAALPDIVLKLSLRALVQGTIAPTMVEVVGARVSLLRGQDGGFQFGSWEETGAGEDNERTFEGDFSRMAPRVIRRLLGRPAPDDPWSFLRVVRIAGGRVVVNDRMLGTVWTAPYADIELRRDEDGLSGEFALKVDLGERQADILVLLDYSNAAEQIDISARFSDLVPKAVVSIAPGLTAIGGLTMPLAGTVSASLSATGALIQSNFEVRGGAGFFGHEDLAAGPLPVRSLSAKGSVTASDRRMTLDSAVVELGSDSDRGPRLTLSGDMTSADLGFRGDLEVSVQALVEDVALADLERYWPLDIATGPRDWVIENVNRGTANKASLKTSFTAPNGDFAAADLHELGGTLDFTGIAVHFLRPMPPVTGISGRADFDEDRLTFYPSGGRLGTLEIQEAAIEITGFKRADEIIAIEIAAVAPLQDALELLDHDRLKLVRELDMEAGSIQGLMAARVEFNFPLLKDLDFDDIEISAAANLAQVSAKSLLFGQDATDGRLKVTLDKAGMVLTGPVTFAGIGMDINWAEDFTENSAEPTRIEFTADRVDAKARAALGIEIDSYVTGPMSAHVIARRDNKKNTVIEAKLGLRDALIEVAPVFWKKPVGIEGTAKLTVELFDDRARRISQFDVEAGAMRARGNAAFDPSGTTLDKISFSDLALDATVLSGVDLDFSQRAVEVRIEGGVLDVTPWLTDEPEQRERASSSSSNPNEIPLETEYAPLTFSAQNLDAMIFGPDRYLEQVNVNLVRSVRGWEKAAMNGSVPRSLWRSDKGESGADLSGDSPKAFKLDYGPASGGGKRLLITFKDMGAVLRALDIVDTVNGGSMEIVGTSLGPLPDAKLNARIEGRDYVLVGASSMARLLTLASLTGIGDALNGEGIGFQRLIGEFTLENDIVRTDLIRAYGPALGLTAKGTIDFDRDETSLQGTIVPAYTFNRILGVIPLLGPLLTGGEGEGLFAATYKATGPVSEPEVSVNALAALAPGFLRNLFSGSSIPDDEKRALPEHVDP